MKKILVIAVSFLCFFNSCKKQSDVNTDNIDEHAIIDKQTRASINCTPAVGGFSPNSTSAVTLSGGGNTYTGGVIKAKVKSFNTSTKVMVITISKQAGGNFSVAGTASVLSGSVNGTSLAGTTYGTSTASVDVTVSVSLTTGYLHLYPVVQGAGGYYYAEPILVYTSPFYNGTASSAYGTVYGTTNYANNSNYSGTYQCVEFAKRYFINVYGVTSLSSYSVVGAKNLYTNSPAPAGVTRIANGTGAIRAGDMIIFDGPTQTIGGTTAKFGHVAIVMEVTSTYVKVAQQNTYGVAPIAFQLTRTGNTVGDAFNSTTSPSPRPCLGWLRKS
jgi:CHAP domain